LPWPQLEGQAFKHLNHLNSRARFVQNLACAVVWCLGFAA